MPTQIFTLLFTFIFLTLYSFTFIFLPGLALTYQLKLPKLDKLTLSLVTGLSVYSFLVYLVRFIHLPYFFTEGLLLTLICIHHHQQSLTKLNFKPKLNPHIITFLALASIAALVQSAVLLRSGLATPQGILFTNLSYHDSMQHISFIKRLYHQTNLIHPGFSGANLTNYHYLIDIVISSLSRFSFVDLYHTYYRFYPLAISFIFSLSIFVYTRQLTKKSWPANLAVFLTIFSGNASYFAQFLRGDHFSWGSNTFLINPIVDILQNPASIFVLAQLLMVIYLFNLYTSHKKSPTLTLVSIAIIAGTMIGFKAWGGLLITFGLSLASLWHLVKNKDFKPILALIASLIISLFIFLPHYQKSTSASPVWAPGWSLRRMLNDQDRYNDIPQIFQEEHYIYTQNYKRLILLYAQWVAIYFFGNYWIRTIGFFAIIYILKNHIKITPTQVLIVSITLASLFLPLIFNQGRMAYDIEQFSPYAIVLASIFTAHTLAQFQSFTKRRYDLPQLSLPIVLILSLLSVPSNYTSIKARLVGESTLVSNLELEALAKVTSTTSPTDTILLFPSHRNIATLEFAALTNRNTFYSGRTLSVITGEPFEDRKKQLDQFFNNNDPSFRQRLIRDNHITHLFLFSEDQQYITQLPESAKHVFSNSAASFYQLE